MDNIDKSIKTKNHNDKMIEIYCTKCGKLLQNHINTRSVRRLREIICPYCKCVNYVEPYRKYNLVLKHDCKSSKGKKLQ